jgi:hypothetical protein
MITGSNTDVDYGGRTYHVQTEDKGRENLVVESLIYCQGEILGTRRIDYSDRVTGGYDEAVIAEFLERQHQRLIREIRNGLWSPEGPKLVGEEILTDRPFNELVGEFLETDADLQRVHLSLEGESDLAPERKTRLRLRARQGDAQGPPAAGAHLTVRLVGEGADPVHLAEGESDEEGRFETNVDLSLPGGRPAALVIASGTPGGGLLRIPLTDT